MFYVNEIFLRFKYSLFSFFFTIFILYLYKINLLYICTSSIFSFFYLSDNLNYFIYTNPSELFNIYLLIVFFFSIILNIYYIFWHFLDFIKTSLFLLEYQRLKFLYLFFLQIISYFNFFCFLYLFPYIYFFFDTFNKNNCIENNINIFLELRIQEYLFFVLNFFYLINLILFLFILISFLCLYLKFENLLKCKKFFIFLNIIFATLLSPPDVYTQLIFFFFLTLFLEIFIIVYLLINKTLVTQYFNNYEI